MLKPKQLDDLSQRLAGSLPKGLQTLQEDISRNLRATLEAGLAKLDLVTREEFEVQAAVLARTRAKLQALEAQVSELEHAQGVGAARQKTTATKKAGTTKSPR
jgi:ubiquinone biosynthesis accessory factor UbiK